MGLNEAKRVVSLKYLNKGRNGCDLSAKDVSQGKRQGDQIETPTRTGACISKSMTRVDMQTKVEKSRYWSPFQRGHGEAVVDRVGRSRHAYQVERGHE